ncbi:fungal trichothecene efflux pump [Coniochaeta sp. 2T2.1]|nr:fungal trichothecene efflux pump [Coniochaeta sp. 2T2.1]
MDPGRENTEKAENVSNVSMSEETKSYVQVHHADAAAQGFETSADELPKNYYRSAYFIGTMIACGAAFASGVGGFALSAAILGVINADIGPSPYLTWVAMAYTLTVAIGLLLVGRLSDLFGRRWFFISGSVFGLIGCIVCAVAQSVETLIGGTTLIGLGAASQISVVFVTAELVPVKHRFLANGFVFLWATPFTGMGPSIAYAFLVYYGSWRPCYYLMIGMNTLATACWFFFYYPPTFEMKHPGQRIKSYLLNFDIVGLFLFVGGVLIFLMGLSWGGGLYAWNSAHVLGAIIVGGAATVAFVLWEWFGNPKEPLMPLHLFKNLAWVALIFCLSISVTVYYAFAIVWPQMVFGVYETDLIRGGLLCTLVGAGTNIGQLCSGLFGRALGNHRWQFTGGCIIGGVFLGAAACCTPYNLGLTSAFVTIGSLALGYTDSIGLTMAGIAIANQEDIGTAVGIAGCVRSIVSTIGTAIYTVILSNRLAQTIPAHVPPALISAGLPESSVADFLTAYPTGTFEGIAGLTPTILAAGVRAYKEASAKAYQTVFLSTIAFSVVAVILALFTANGMNMMTDDVATTLHERKTKKVVGKEGDVVEA